MVHLATEYVLVVCVTHGKIIVLYSVAVIECGNPVWIIISPTKRDLIL